MESVYGKLRSHLLRKTQEEQEVEKERDRILTWIISNFSCTARFILVNL